MKETARGMLWIFVVTLVVALSCSGVIAGTIAWWINRELGE